MVVLCTLRCHVAVADGGDAELQQPPVVPVIHVRRAFFSRDPNDCKPPHVGEQDVLQKVKNQNKKSGILVGQGADDEPGVDGTGAGVVSGKLRYF